MLLTQGAGGQMMTQQQMANVKKKPSPQDGQDGGGAGSSAPPPQSGAGSAGDGQQQQGNYQPQGLSHFPPPPPPQQIVDQGTSAFSTIANNVKERMPGGFTGGNQGAGAGPNAPGGRNRHWNWTNYLPGNMYGPPTPGQVANDAANAANNAAGSAGSLFGNIPNPADVFSSLGNINIFQLLQQMGIIPNFGGDGGGGGGTNSGGDGQPTMNQPTYATLSAPLSMVSPAAGRLSGITPSPFMPQQRPAQTRQQGNYNPQSQMAGGAQAQSGAPGDPLSQLSRYMSQTDIANLLNTVGKFNDRNRDSINMLGNQVGDLSQAGYLGQWSRDVAREATQRAINLQRDADLRDIAGRAGRGGVVGSGSAQGVYSNAIRAGKDAELALNDRAYSEEMGRLGQLGNARNALAGMQTAGNQMDYNSAMDQVTSNKELMGLLLGFLPQMVDAAVPF